jgi:ankyrin repeat protein
MTELISKAADGDWRAVKKPLEAGADPTLADHQGLTTLDHAVFYGHLDVVSTLLAETEQRFRLEPLLLSRGCSCLDLASHNGHLEVVKALVKAGGEALLIKTDADGFSCLHAASQNGHLEVTKGWSRLAARHS